MDPLFPEHRKRYRAFDAVEVMDEAAIAALRGQLTVAVPLELNWTWEYGCEVEELRNLYEKGKVHQWNAETDLDWTVPCPADEWLLQPEASILAQICKLGGKDEATQKAALRDEAGYLLSQLLHGEQAALQLCGQLTNVCERMDEKWYAASQVADEARHVEVVSKFLHRKTGTLFPIGATNKLILDLLLAARTVEQKTLGMQVLFEGVALGILSGLRARSRNPLLTEILKRMGQDEARHAAFGVLMMRRAVRDASRAELDGLEDWSYTILEALNANQSLDMLRVLGPRYGIDPEFVVSLSTSRPNFAQANSASFMHTVVPNLKSLGPLTERTQARWAQRGMVDPAKM